MPPGEPLLKLLFHHLRFIIILLIITRLTVVVCRLLITGRVAVFLLVTCIAPFSIYAEALEATSMDSMTVLLSAA